MQRLRKVLIANRGEIACRIARTCRRLGLAVATVHSSADRSALHVREIGESIEIGSAAAATGSYLNIEAVIGAALRVGANAVHPGYGFLSENAAFVRAVEAAGLVFIGPTAATIERLGGKASAKREAAALGLPVIAGSDRGLVDAAAVAAQVRRMSGADRPESEYRRAQQESTLIGAPDRPDGEDQSAPHEAGTPTFLPVLLKAVAGGGGRGMVIIDSLDGLDARIDSAMREAEQGFGSGELIVERYLPHVRHIEVQIAGDGHGQAIHLYERECTLQRRHQKVIEEAPAAGLPAQLLETMRADACRLAAAAGYRGLGTVEFIVADGMHHFLEVNPRLQVEHPVTEAVTGLDLVELQLRIADEGRLPLAQADVRCHGHAFEARVCAEDADTGFLPATGRIVLARFPGPPLRVDAGVASGDEVTPHYDSMIAKLIAHADTREAARAQLQAGLAATRVLGVVTNLAFLQQLLALPETRDSTFHTRLIDERWGAAARAANTAAAPADLGVANATAARADPVAAQRNAAGAELQTANASATEPPFAFEYRCAAALFWLDHERGDAPAGDLGCWSDRNLFTGWRLATSADPQPAALPSLRLQSRGGGDWPVRYSRRLPDGTMRLAIGDEVEDAALEALGDSSYLLHCARRALELSIVGDTRCIEVAGALGNAAFDCTPYLGGAALAAAASGQLAAPMMGKVVAIRAQPGERVACGHTVIVLESMKMELHVNAPFDATVQKLRCAPGDMVARGAVLADVSPAA